MNLNRAVNYTCIAVDLNLMTGTAPGDVVILDYLHGTKLTSQPYYRCFELTEVLHVARIQFLPFAILLSAAADSSIS